jgi:hypothetical protein
MRGVQDLRTWNIVTITHGFTKCGVWFKPPAPPSSSSGGGIFIFKNKFTFESYHHTIVVGHGQHVWGHQMILSIFKGDWHH